MSEPTVRELLESIAAFRNDLSSHDAQVAALMAEDALAALDAEEARTVVNEPSGDTCTGCALMNSTYDDSQCNHPEAPGYCELPSSGSRPDWCPLNDGGRVVVRLAVVG